MLRPTPTVAPGTRIGPYVVDSELGRGGMGMVLRVHHAETGVPHALKLLIGKDDAEATRRAFVRFRREAELLARAGPSSGVVHIHAFGIDAGRPWYAMDLIDGQPLSERVRVGPIPPREAAMLIAQVARTVEACHGHGVLHRDLKPENIIIDPRGRPLLLDLGIAYDVLAESLTRTGEVLGTPAYMSPEQLGRGDLSRRTDVYGLGATLYTLLTGRPPFDETGGMALLHAILKLDPVTPGSRVREIPIELETVCLQAMAKLPGDRYPSAEELAEDLERWLRGEPVEARRVGRIRRLLRRARPRTRTGAAIALVALACAVTAVAGGTVLVRGLLAGERPAEEILLAWERSLEIGERVPEVAPVDRILERDEVRASARLTRRARLLRALIDAVTSEEPRSVAVDDVAELVRPDGRIHDAALRRAATILARHDRIEALHHVVFGATPAAIAPDSVAVKLAVAMAANPVALPPPNDEAIFAALSSAPTLRSATRARLLAAHGRALAAAGPERWEAALSALELALDRYGVTPSTADPFPEGFLVRVLEEVLARIDAQPERIRPLVDLLVRLPGDPGSALGPDLILRLQAAVLACTRMLESGKVSENAGRRAVLTASALERFGLAIPVESLGDPVVNAFEVERIVRWGEEEAALPPERRNPAVLLHLARLVGMTRRTEREAPRWRELIDAWIDAAEATGVSGIWSLVQVSRLRCRTDAWQEALNAAEDAIALDRALPMARRWPVATHVLLELVFEAPGEVAAEVGLDLARTSRVVLESIEVRRVAAARVRDLSDLSAFGLPWRFPPAGAIERYASLGVERRINAGDADCGDDDVPGIDELVDAALRLAEENPPSIRPGPLAMSVSSLRGSRAKHHRGHGRFVDALADAEAGVAIARSQAGRGPDANTRRHLAGLLRLQATILEELGRPEEAAPIRAEVELLTIGDDR